MNVKISKSTFYKLIFIHISLTGIVALLLHFLGAAPNWSDYAVGAAISGGNLLLILWSIRHAIVKKSFALAAAASVFKYGFLIFLFWLATQLDRKVGYEFLIGVLLILPTTVLVALDIFRSEKDVQKQ